MSFLYVIEQGAYIRKKGPHVQVVKEEEVLTDRAMRDVKCLVVFGGVQVTSEAMLGLLDAGCDISFMTLNGHFKGRLVSAAGKNSILRATQYGTFTDESKRFELAKRYVTAKIRNGMDVLQDYHHSGRSDFVFTEKAALEEILNHIETRAENRKSLLGYEGAAAKLYFGAFARCLGHGRKFPGRVFYPSTDPVNALLSFGYSFVTRELQAVIEAMGFDPYIGFFHEVSYGRPSLSLDLMEEFRHPFVDRLVLRLLNKRILDDDDFQTEQDGQVILKKDSMKVFIKHYEEWANSVNRAKNDEGELSWRQAIWRQGEKLRHAIENNTDYLPFSWKKETESENGNVNENTAGEDHEIRDGI